MRYIFEMNKAEKNTLVAMLSERRNITLDEAINLAGLRAKIAGLLPVPIQDPPKDAVAE